MHDVTGCNSAYVTVFLDALNTKTKYVTFSQRCRRRTNTWLVWWGAPVFVLRWHLCKKRVYVEFNVKQHVGYSWKTQTNIVSSRCVGKKLFGEGYSGLEYDYRGLIKLYNSVGNYEKVFEYHNILSNWNRLRDRQFAVADALEDVNTTPQQTQEVVQAFLVGPDPGAHSARPGPLREGLKGKKDLWA